MNKYLILLKKELKKINYYLRKKKYILILYGTRKRTKKNRTKNIKCFE